MPKTTGLKSGLRAVTAMSEITGLKSGLRSYRITQARIIAQSREGRKDA